MNVESKERSPRVEEVREITYYGIYDSYNGPGVPVSYRALNEGETVEEMIAKHEQRLRYPGYRSLDEGTLLIDAVWVHDRTEVTIALPDGLREFLLGEDRNRRNYWIDPREVISVEEALERKIMPGWGRATHYSHIVLPRNSGLNQGFNPETDRVITRAEISEIK